VNSLGLADARHESLQSQNRKVCYYYSFGIVFTKAPKLANHQYWNAEINLEMKTVRRRYSA